MNYLAHCCLVPSSPQTLAGSIFGDVVHGRSLAHLPTELAMAIRLHRKVDVWTDAHPENKAARSLFNSPLRRFAGIIIDMSYDHFLARNFESWEHKSLPAFAEAIYAALQQYEHLLDDKGKRQVRYIYQNDLLNQYRQWSGVSLALKGIASRLSRPTALAGDHQEIVTRLPQLEAHFVQFYPQLKHYAHTVWETLMQQNSP